jgi:hypothetical protein
MPRAFPTSHWRPASCVHPLYETGRYEIHDRSGRYGSDKTLLESCPHRTEQLPRRTSGARRSTWRECDVRVLYMRRNGFQLASHPAASDWEACHRSLVARCSAAKWNGELIADLAAKSSLLLAKGRSKTFVGIGNACGVVAH